MRIHRLGPHAHGRNNSLGCTSLVLIHTVDADLPQVRCCELSMGDEVGCHEAPVVMQLKGAQPSKGVAGQGSCKRAGWPHNAVEHTQTGQLGWQCLVQQQG